MAWAVLFTGFVACPCHFPITLPILAAVLSGAAAGAFLSERTGLIVLLAAVYFVVAILIGFWLLGRRKSTDGGVGTPDEGRRLAE